MSNDDDQLSELQFFCPHTNRPLNTGVRTDDRSLAMAWDRPMHLQCPHCGMEHNFRTRDVCFDQALRLVRRYVSIDATYRSYTRPPMNQLGEKFRGADPRDLVDRIGRVVTNLSNAPQGGRVKTVADA